MSEKNAFFGVEPFVALGKSQLICLPMPQNLTGAAIDFSDSSQMIL
jgi:hypothetical protein